MAEAEWGRGTKGIPLIGNFQLHRHKGEKGQDFRQLKSKGVSEEKELALGEVR